jgi:S-DNA-T family DNA segregation ATPase FtsK/SpoIIIE
LEHLFGAKLATMARRKPTRKKQSQPSAWQTLADVLTRPGFIGSVLVLMAIFTLLSLLSGSRGTLTGAWVTTLRDWFGVGVWMAPLALGIIGLWLVFAAMEQIPTPAWRRPIGVFVLFMAFIIGASLLLRPDVRAQVTSTGSGGGQVGTALADLLQTTITSVGAWAFVAFLAVSGIIFLTDRMLIDGVARAILLLNVGLGGRRERAPHSPAHGQINPQVPLPLGEISAFQRWRERWLPQGANSDPFSLPASGTAGSSLRQVVGKPEEAPAPPLRAPNLQPSHAVSGGGAPQPAQPAWAQGGPQVAPQAAPTRAPDLLHPRIIGGSPIWQLPRVDLLLDTWEREAESDAKLRDNSKLIETALLDHGIPATVEDVNMAASVTRFLLRPDYKVRVVKGEEVRKKVKVSEISALARDLALVLAAKSVRVEAPVPGTNYVGIEVSNTNSNTVGLRELLETERFQTMRGALRVALGENLTAEPVVADLTRMPHLLIAGATGSGKSVCINSIITCLLLTHTPDSLRLLMVDPKMVELSVYNGVPHLLSPVVTEVDKAAGVLYWAVKEMERRYSLCNKAGARDIIRYNEYLTKRSEKPLPYIVVIVDEMADLMMAAPEEVEKHICRLAQMARAVGIHLIIATQRPSVDVITGLIKANFPARIAFAVTSQIDSRVILDVPGAEQLLGRGDMLFMSPEGGKLERLQGTYLSDDEINRVVSYWKGLRTLHAAPTPWEQGTLLPAEEMDAQEKSTPVAVEKSAKGLFTEEETAAFTQWTNPKPGAGARTVAPTTNLDDPLFAQIDALKAVDDRDVLFDDAVRVVREADKGSVSLLQKKLRIGYGRAARLVDQMVAAGILGAETSTTGVRTVAGSPTQRSGSAPPSPAPPRGPQQPMRKPHIIGDADDTDETDAVENTVDDGDTATSPARPDSPGAPQSAPGVWM